MWLRFFLPYLILINITDLLFKIGAHMDLHPLYFSAQAMVFGGFVLLAISRPGPLALDTIRSTGTWAYAFLFLAGNVVLFYSLMYVDILTASLLKGSAAIFSPILAGIFINSERLKINRIKFLSLCALCFGLILLIGNMPSELIGPSIAICIGAGILVSITALTQELHEASNKTKGRVIHELRVTGLAIGVTALVFGITIIVGSLMRHYFELNIPSLFAPSIEQIVSIPSMVFALVYGVFLLSSIRFLQFYWIKKIKIENYTLFYTLLPIGAIAMDYLGDYFGLAPMKGLSPIQWVSCVIIILAAIVAQKNTKVIKQQKTYKASIKQREKDRDLAQYAMNRNKGDRVKTAEMLNISEHALASALGETDEDLTPEISQKLQENFTHHMAFIDSLTGLMNRSKFMQQLEEILNKKTKGVLVYLDLDKFKPINDTHGHAVGDAVLRIVSQRFRQHIRGAGFASRLGGDEFSCVMTKGDEKSVKALIKSIEEPIQLDGIDEPLQVGASSGSVSLPARGKTAEEVLNQADKRMYENKKGR